MKPLLQQRGLVFDASQQPEQQRVAAFTGLFRSSDGTIFCSFQNGPEKHATTATVRLFRSDDSGATWSDVGCRLETVIDGVRGSLSSGELVEVEPGRLLMFATVFDRRDPERPLFDPETEGILHSKQLLAESRDSGKTWSPWHEVPTPGLKGCSATGPVMRWSDGRIAYAFESYKEYDDPTPGRHGAWLLVSRDNGETFQPHLVAQHPEHRVYYWDQRLCLGSEDGSYVALFWTHDLKRQWDLTVHLRRGHVDDPPEMASEITATPIPGQIAAPLLLADSRLLAFVIDRESPGAMKLWVSPDGGKTWPEEDCLTVYKHDEQAQLSQGSGTIDYAEYWEEMGRWTFGHPAAIQLDEHHVLLAFYAGVPKCLSIHWARVEI